MTLLTVGLGRNPTIKGSNKKFIVREQCDVTTLKERFKVQQEVINRKAISFLIEEIHGYQSTVNNLMQGNSYSE